MRRRSIISRRPPPLPSGAHRASSVPARADPRALDRRRGVDDPDPDPSRCRRGSTRHAPASTSRHERRPQKPPVVHRACGHLGDFVGALHRRSKGIPTCAPAPVGTPAARPRSSGLQSLVVRSSLNRGSKHPGNLELLGCDSTRRVQGRPEASERHRRTPARTPPQRAQNARGRPGTKKGAGCADAPAPNAPGDQSAASMTMRREGSRPWLLLTTPAVSATR